MGCTPEELNHEIAGTREALATDLDALQDRVSPQAIIDRRKAAFRLRSQDLRSRVMGSTPGPSDRSSSPGKAVVASATHRVDGSPIAAGLTAFFAGMLVSAIFPASEAESTFGQRAVDTAKEHGRPVVDSVGTSAQEMAADLKESGQNAVEELKDSTQQSARRVRDEGQESVHNLSGRQS